MIHLVNTRESSYFFLLSIVFFLSFLQNKSDTILMRKMDDFSSRRSERDKRWWSTDEMNETSLTFY